MRRQSSIVILIICINLLLSGCGNEKEEARIEKVIPWEMGFLAVGSQGQVLEIDADGHVTEIETADADFTDIWSGGDSIWIAGKKGILLRAGEDFSFTEEETGCAENLYAGAYFKGKSYCGGEKGTVICSTGNDTWEPCSVTIEGTVIGMEVSDSRCLLVTDTGETAVTEDGNTWTVLRYNEYYQKEVTFQGLTYDGNNFWAYGKEKGAVKLLYSDSGTVWGERDINYLEGKDVDLSETQILSMVSDGQQLYAWCEDGELLTLPDCIKCNKKTVVEGVGEGKVGYNGGKLLIAEDASHVKMIDTETAKQYLVSAETARQKQQEGAVLIDVRDAGEHEEKSIKGSVCIPLDELSEKLPELYPDQGQVLIFYCAKGIRSQSAVEKAVKLGYVEVYSMGSIDNWMYEFE